MLDFITINTHSSIKMTAEKTIYFDPFKITDESHDADIVFVTHEHFDHFSPDDIALVAKEDTVLVVPESMKEKAAEACVKSENIVCLKPCESHEICGIKVETVPSYNTNKPMHPKANGWLGYIVTIADMRVYVAGDTDATEEAEAVVCDAAMIPIGGTYTMNTEEAAALINKMRPKYALPTHYGDIVGEATDGIDFAVDVDPGIETVLKMKI